MIRYEENPEHGYVELTLDGKIDRAGFQDIVSKLGPLMDRTGRVGILKHIVSFGGMSPSVLWDDLKFGFEHLKHVGPVAVVSDKKWIEVWTKLAAPLWMRPVKFFEEDDLDDAREWLAEEMAKAAKTAAADG